MKKQPIIKTERLQLRPFRTSDAVQVRLLAGDRDIAITTCNIPHPYKDGVAEKWIETHYRKFQKGEEVNFAIVDSCKGTLIGAIGLVVKEGHRRAELGYWVGKPYWNHGYCTEAARAVLKYGFEVLGLNRIHACHFHNNAASGRVIKKIGLKYEGLLRQHIKKADKFVDLDMYGMLKSEFRD